ncbi:MAG: SsrA-binding protein SmpB [Verrucomicrobiae bacterium]|nr:SsrA-binding protein SmpB [Verrucomicrobiae bacterium]
MANKNKGKDRFTEIRNAKAFRNFEIGERFEAGIALRGTEVKSVRNQKAQINEAFCRVEKNEVILFHAHIAEYEFGNYSNHNPRRPRKLLLKRREINKIRGALEAEGKTLIPLRLYITHGLVKVEIALCVGKKLYDKRQDLKKKVQMREVERALKNY